MAHRIGNWQRERDRRFLIEVFSQALGSAGEVRLGLEDIADLAWERVRIPRRTLFRLLATGSLGYFADRYARLIGFSKATRNEKDPLGAVFFKTALSLRAEGLRPRDILKLPPVVEWLTRLRLEGEVLPVPFAPTWAACRFLDDVITAEDVRLLLAHLRTNARKGKPSDPFIARRVIRWGTGNHHGQYVVFGRLGQERDLTDQFRETFKLIERCLKPGSQSYAGLFSEHDLGCALGRFTPENGFLVRQAGQAAGDEGTGFRRDLLAAVVGYYDLPLGERYAFVWKEGLRQMRAHADEKDPLDLQWFFPATWMLECRRAVDGGHAGASSEERQALAELYTSEHLALVEGHLLKVDPKARSYFARELEPINERSKKKPRGQAEL